jgi:flagella basal body P-ring formation protein FlgA
MTRKHVVAMQDLRAGQRLEPRKVGLKRTPHSDPIHDIREVLGHELRRSLRKDDPITRDDISERPVGVGRQA